MSPVYPIIPPGDRTLLFELDFAAYNYIFICWQCGIICTLLITFLHVHMQLVKQDFFSYCNLCLSKAFIGRHSCTNFYVNLFQDLQFMMTSEFLWSWMMSNSFLLENNENTVFAILSSNVFRKCHAQGSSNWNIALLQKTCFTVLPVHIRIRIFEHMLKILYMATTWEFWIHPGLVAKSVYGVSVWGQCVYSVYVASVWDQGVGSVFGVSLWRQCVVSVCGVSVWGQCVVSVCEVSVRGQYVNPVCVVSVWIQCVGSVGGSSVWV